MLNVWNCQTTGDSMGLDLYIFPPVIVPPNGPAVVQKRLGNKQSGEAHLDRVGIHHVDQHRIPALRGCQNHHGPSCTLEVIPADGLAARFLIDL